jgi:hypothetical protein
MTARPDPFRTHVADQVFAALAEAAPLPLSTPDVEKRTGYGRRHGQLVYIVLARLAACGEVEKLAAPGVTCRGTDPDLFFPPDGGPAYASAVAKFPEGRPPRCFR